MWLSLGLNNREPDFSRDAAWDLLAPGTSLGQPAPLFPRLAKKKTGGKQQQPKAKSGKASNRKKDKGKENLIDISEFSRIDLRLAEIKSAERIEKSDRLLKLTVLAPEERTVVAGIAEHYSPDELIGRQVILVANLKPAKLMGVESHGMVLAIKDGGRLILSSGSERATPGSRVS